MFKALASIAWELVRRIPMAVWFPDLREVDRRFWRVFGSRQVAQGLRASDTQ